jgi:uncharacterized protein YoxC
MCRIKPRRDVKKCLAEICKFLITLNEKVDTLMSETQDRLDALNARLADVDASNQAAAAGIREDITGLKQDIADLKEQVANGQTPDFTAIEARATSMEEGAASLKALDEENPEQVPTPEPTPEQPQG